MKYELVSLSVTIRGKVIRKAEKLKLDDSKLPKAELEAAYLEGFIKPEGSKSKTPQDVIEEARKVFAKRKDVADKKAKTENEEAHEAAAEAKAKELKEREAENAKKAAEAKAAEEAKAKGNK